MIWLMSVLLVVNIVVLIGLLRSIRRQTTQIKNMTRGIGLVVAEMRAIRVPVSEER